MSLVRSGARTMARVVCGRRTKWAVLIVWLVLIVVAAPAAQKLGDAENNNNASWLPGNAESTKVIDQASEFRPDTAPAVIVYTRPGGLTEPDLNKAAADASRLRGLSQHGIEGDHVAGPILNRPRQPQAALTVLPITISTKGWTSLASAVDSIRDIVNGGNPQGLQVYVTGPAGTAADSNAAFEGIDSTLLFAALAVVVIILLVTYRSLTLLALPVLSVVGALFTAQAVIYLLARHAGLVVNAQSAGILTVLVFGAGTDYALLLVARYREELRRHEDRHDAMERALHRAGPAILASGATVVASMLCLLVAEMNSTNGLGPVAAIGVTVGLIAMLTLFPALLVIFGRWVFWPAVPHMGSADPTRSGLWARVGRGIARRPRTIWVTTAAVLAGLSVGLVTLDASGLSNAEQFTGTPESVKGQRVQARYFPAGAAEPLIVITNAGAARQVARVVDTTEGVLPGSVRTPPGVAQRRDDRVYLEATLRDAADSKAAEHTVDRVRDRVHPISGADALVGGDTAILVDANRATAHDRNLIIPMILAVVLVILGLLLWALVAPLVLIATVVLSFAAALGVSALAFRYVFDFAGADTAFPLFVFVFLVALGIDYNIFLMTRVREESTVWGTRRGTLAGLAATGGVISSAGLVLAGTFATLATLPVVGFAEIGFTVALGVLLDTFVVRSVLVCALSLDLDHRMWWPNRLPGDRGAGQPDHSADSA